MDEGKRWDSITFKDATVGHFYEDKNDVSMQMLILMFFIYIQKCSLLFQFICPWPWLTECRNCSQVPLDQMEMYHYYSTAGTAGKHKTAMQLLTNSSGDLSIQTPDFIILLISSFFLWIICCLLCFFPVLSSWCGKTHQESVSRPHPYVSQSKTRASSSSLLTAG